MVSCSRLARFSSDLLAILVTRSVNIVEIATGMKIPLSGEISFASITSLTMLSIKRFKVIYNYIIRLVREVIKVEIV